MVLQSRLSSNTSESESSPTLNLELRFALTQKTFQTLFGSDASKFRVRLAERRKMTKRAKVFFYTSRSLLRKEKHRWVVKSADNNKVIQKSHEGFASKQKAEENFDLLDNLAIYNTDGTPRNILAHCEVGDLKGAFERGE